MKKHDLSHLTYEEIKKERERVRRDREEYEETLGEELERRREERLRHIHEELEYQSRADMIEALMRMEGGARKPKTVINGELKSKILGEVQRGEKTSKEISREYRVSIPTIQKIKREAGLTKPPGKKKAKEGDESQA